MPSSPPGGNGPQQVVLGLAGLSWTALASRARAGAVPRLADLIARGAATRLLADTPPASIACWATIASGVQPEEHGLVLPQEPWAGGFRPTGRASWRVAPVWQRLADAGYRTASVAWPGASPGAGWAGCHVDARIAQAVGATAEAWALPIDVAPPELRPLLRDIRVHPAAISGAILHPFVPRLAEVDQSRDTGLADLALMVAGLSTRQAAIFTVLDECPFDLAIFHHGWMEQVLARFEGAQPPFDRIEDAAWTILDAAIGEIADELRADASLLIVSPGRPGEPGIAIASGGYIAPGRRLATMRTLDIVPTILSGFGLRDAALPGRPAYERAGALRALPPAFPTPAAIAPDPADIRRVGQFGHVVPEIPPSWRTRRDLTLAWMIAPRDPVAAGTIAERIVEQAGDAPAPLAIIALARTAAGEIEALPALATRIDAVSADPAMGALVRGAYHALRGEGREAAPYLARAERTIEAEHRIRIGIAYLIADRPADAARVFAAILDEQPEHVEALIGLARTRLTEPLAAEPLLRRVLAIDDRCEPARTLLADLLERTGRRIEAGRLRTGA